MMYYEFVTVIAERSHHPIHAGQLHQGQGPCHLSTQSAAAGHCGIEPGAMFASVVAAVASPATGAVSI